MWPCPSGPLIILGLFIMPLKSDIYSFWPGFILSGVNIFANDEASQSRDCFTLSWLVIVSWQWVSHFTVGPNVSCVIILVKCGSAESLLINCRLCPVDG